jgi:Uma2 family endonuclease
MRATAGREEPLFYPEEEVVGETHLHLLIRLGLFTLVRRLLDERGEPSFVGSDAFLYWVPGNAQRCVSPDLYVFPGVDPATPARSWKLWEHERPPSLVLEVVSDDVDKDYVQGPMRYAEIGVDELVIYDPEPERGRDRVRWQVYRRRDGELLLEQQGDGDRVRCESLGCWLRVVPDDAGRPLLRIALGPEGDDLLPTEAEAVEARNRALERELAELKRKLRQD